MATLKQAKELLRQIDVTVKRKSSGKFPFSYRNADLSIKESDIDDYLSLKNGITFPKETAISSTYYYEHVVDFQGFRGMPPRFRMRGNESMVVEDKEKSEKITLSTISPRFLFAILDKEEKNKNFLRYLMRPMMMGRFRNSDEENDICSLFRIYTIRLDVDPEKGKQLSEKSKESIAESALFNFAYNFGFASILSQSWEREYFRLGKNRTDTTQYPLRTYKSDLLAYYQLALSSESMILSYLALYKIIEYFYTSSSEKVLHDKIKHKLVLPEFHHTKPRQLRDLVSLIRKNDQKTDERKMLINVLEEYFYEAESKEWIDEYESENGIHFTNNQTIFGEEHKLDTNTSQIFSSIASRIYHIRNAIVHNKESELSRFIPFSGQEQTLFKEIPLLKHIAEGLIIKTGKER